MEGNVAVPAALIGDPVRAGILMALSDGRAQPATALACATRVSAQSASNHLAKLLEGGLLSVERQGRHRYYRLATPQVAVALEALTCLSPPPKAIPMTAQARLLAFGRSCYDHLAGRLGVAVASRLEELGHLAASAPESKIYTLTDEGRRWFGDLGVEVDLMKSSCKGLARRCLDWTERRHHLAGPLGNAFLSQLLAEGWLRRERKSRAVDVTPAGMKWFSESLNIDVRSLRRPADPMITNVARRTS